MIKALTLFLSLTTMMNTSALEVEGVQIPNKVKVLNKELVHNGSGIRHATFLNVNVYVGTLYLLQKTTDVETLLDMEYPKQVSMNFIRDVTKEELVGAWKEGFEAAVSPKQQKALSKTLNQFIEKMEAIQKKDSIYLKFLNNGVELQIKGKNYGPLGNQEFSRALLSIWFVNARDEKLRDGMLGKN
jgi:DUF1680 family protein